MPPKKQQPRPVKQKSLQQVVDDLGLYPAEAFEFIQQGLSYTVQKTHGQAKAPAKGAAKGRRLKDSKDSPKDSSKDSSKEPPADVMKDPEASRHISGQQLCQGLLEFAQHQWGLLARTVLRRWNITSTLDFGRIVFALVDAGHMQKTDEDSLEDFKDVFDFRTAFDGYRIHVASA